MVMGLPPVGLLLHQHSAWALRLPLGVEVRLLPQLFPAAVSIQEGRRAESKPGQ